MLPGQPPPPLFFPPFPNEEKMRRGHMNDEAPLGLLGETHEVGKGAYTSWIYRAENYSVLSAPTISPRRDELAPHFDGLNPYRTDHRIPQQQVFDLDLDLNQQELAMQTLRHSCALSSQSGQIDRRKMALINQECYCVI